MYAGLGDSLRIIAVDRPIEASIRSLQDRSNKHRGHWFAADDAACERLQRSLLEHRERFIKSNPKVPVLRVDFAELTKDPAAGIARLVEFLGIDPTEEELESAIAHVNPELRKFGYPKLQIIVSGSQGSQMKSCDAIPNHDRCGQFAATHSSYLNLIRLLLRLGPNASRIVPNETSLAMLSQQLGVKGN